MERDDHELSEDVFIIGKHMGNTLINDNNMDNVEKGLNDVNGMNIGVALLSSYSSPLRLQEVISEPMYLPIGLLEEDAFVGNILTIFNFYIWLKIRFCKSVYSSVFLFIIQERLD